MHDQTVYRTKSRRSKVKKTGRILMTASLIVAILCAVFPSNFLMGIFGVYVFAIAIFVGFIGFCMHRRKKYTIRRRYLTLSFMMVFSFFTAIHIAFTTNQLGDSSTTFGSYLGYGFNHLTPGGVLFAIPAFIFNAIFFLEGALIVLGVKFIVSGAFLATYVLTTHGENKVLSQATELIIEETEIKKQPKDLHKKIDEKYNELLEKQSKKQHTKNKSLLGITPPQPQPVQIREATFDSPIPLSEIPPQPSLPDQINEWSTAAANKLNAGIDTRLSPPLFDSLGPNYVPKIPSQKTPEPEPISYQSPSIFSAPQAASYIPPTFNFPPPIESEPEPVRVTNRDGASWLQGSMVKEPVKKLHKRGKYNKPGTNLIQSESSSLIEAHQEAVVRQHLLDNKLKEFGVNAKVTNVTVAPAVTRFEIQIGTGTRVAQVTQLENDIAYVLGSSNVRIETTIEGKNAIGVEVPNKTIGMVSIKDLLESRDFMNHRSPLAVSLGKNISNDIVIGDIAQMPHLLIAGSTGSGKSVMLNTILTSLLFRAHPEDVKLLLVDMKRVELNMYNNIPHMLIPRAIKEVTHVINALKWMQTEMTRRYDILEQNGVNNIGLYQSLPAYQNGTLERMPYILMVIDEAADLLARGKKEVEDAIKSLSALARACGIHIILATQRPSVDVITAVIKTNFPVRIAFKVGSRGDSQTIINDTGAEKLVGRGDMLFVREGSSQRVQGAFIELEETRRVMNYIRENNPAEFDSNVEDLILNGPPIEGHAGGGFGDADHARKKAMDDPYFIPIAKWIVREDNLTRTVSISNIQRQFSLGFSRAGKIMDALTESGYVSLGNGSKARDVIVSREEIERLYGE